jgi:hypothetical protein
MGPQPGMPLNEVVLIDPQEAGDRGDLLRSHLHKSRPPATSGAPLAFVVDGKRHSGRFALAPQGSKIETALMIRRLLFCSTLLTTRLFAAVSFEADVKPILEFNCVRCHNPKGTDFEKGETDIDLSSRTTAFETKSTIVPGDAAKSKLYTTTVLADDHKKLMPPRNRVTGALERLTKTETEILKNWINEGAKWPETITLTARKEEVGQKAGAEAIVVAEIMKKINSRPPFSNPADMKAYSTTIPGSEVGFDMVPIPGGKFKMGSPEPEPGRKADEGPRREVEIAPFWMGKTEVTWNEFELFMYPDEEKKIREPHKLPPDLNPHRRCRRPTSRTSDELRDGQGWILSDFDDPTCREQ